MALEEEFADLVRRVCGRDEAAAAELVRRFEPELRRVIRFQLTDPKLRRLFDSLDVCQSVLGAFFAQLHAGELHMTQPRQLAGLLALMARHKVIDRARHFRATRHGGGKVAQATNGLEDLTLDTTPGPAQRVADRDLLEVVRGRLQPADREILNRWLLGHEWAEVASQLGGTPEALRKRLSRAIDEVAAQLGLVEGPT